MLLISRSLTATFLRNRIIGVLRKSSDATLSAKANDLDADIIFSHPTVLSLARHLSAIVDESSLDALDPVEQQLHDMTALIEKYTSNIPAVALSRLPPPPRETVLVTGTTGALGSLMLAQLLADERIERVWAVNRPSRGKSLPERQREAFVEKAIDVALLTQEKLRLVEADLSADNLGLSEPLYDEVGDFAVWCSVQKADLVLLDPLNDHPHHLQCVAPRFQSLGHVF